MFSVAKLVGEGYEKPSGESELPLDVNYAKIIDWLVDRKLLPTDWNKKLQAIQSNATRASEELPIGFLTQFEGTGVADEGTIDYLKAKNILTKLAETAEKNLLGSYKGDAGTWEKIVKAYETQQLYVAESSQTIVRNVDYEIPFIKKQIAKNQQLLADLDKRKAESLKSATTANSDYQQECQRLGISEVKTQAELQIAVAGLTSSLPQLIEHALQSVNAEDVGAAIRHYQSFIGMLKTTSMSTTTTANEGSGKQPQQEEVLQVLREVREGRTEPPAKELEGISGTSINNEQQTPEQQQSVIDFGALDLDMSALGGGETTAATGDEANIDISWDFDVSTADINAATANDDDNNDSGIDIVEEVDAGGISWDIDMDVAASGEDNSGGMLGVASEAAAAVNAGNANTAANNGDGNNDESAAVSAVVRRLIWDVAYRTKLLDDLYELHGFLTRRVSELSSKDLGLVTSSAPEDIQSVDADAARTMQTAISTAITTFNNDTLKQLLLVASSAQYRNRLVQSLVRKAGQEMKFTTAAREAEFRKYDISKDLMTDSGKSKALVTSTKKLKELVEMALRGKLNRKVNIQGEINAVLS